MEKVALLLLIFINLIILPNTIACGRSAISGSELPYGQSEALLTSAIGEASQLPDIPHYDLRLEIDMENVSYEGSVVIDYTNLEENSLSSIFLRLLPNGGGTYGEGLIEVSGITVNSSKAASVLSLDDSALEIILERPLEPGDHTTISMDFMGKVPVDFAGGGYGIFSKKDEVLALAGWYPMLAVYDDEGWNVDPVFSIGDSAYSDIAYYTVMITLPEDMGHAATGSLIEKKENNGFTDYRYVSGPVRDFFVIAGKDFEVKSRKIKGITINAYFLPGHDKAADMTLDIAEGSLRTFNKNFGDYPYRELDIVDAPTNGSVAVEFPGIVMVGSPVFGNAVFTSHEIAHQWWYNVVGNDVIDDPWIDEALILSRVFAGRDGQ